MKQNYFIVDGKRYYTGTIFIAKYMGEEVGALFMYYDTEKERYYYRINECVYNVDYKKFQRTFVAITNEIDERARLPSTRRRKDFEINNLFIGWVWYIFLMLVSVIFKDVIRLWILISIVFFTWRSKKIKEEGTYVEW